MTLTIEISAEEEARLRERARQQGENAEAVASALVRAGLDAVPTAEVTEEKHAVLIQRLRDAGLLTELPTERLGPPPRPITVLGPPVSQTLVEDRE